MKIWKKVGVVFPGGGNKKRLKEIYFSRLSATGYKCFTQQVAALSNPLHSLEVGQPDVKLTFAVAHELPSRIER